MKKRVIALMMATTVLVSSLVGCTTSSQSSTEATEAGSETSATETTSEGETTAQEGDSTYRMLYSSEVSTMNYLTSGTIVDQTIGANTVDTLIEYDANGTLEPSLAESWEYDPATLTYTFKLRADQKWIDHTGAVVADVTAQDFVDAMKYVLDPVNASDTEWLLEGIIANASEYYAALSDGQTMDFAEVGVKAVDDLTLQYTLAKEVPYFVSMLGYVCFMPAYGPLLEETGTEFATTAEKMYYNGAYYLSNWEPQVEMVYTKNPNNWDAENVFIDTIEQTYNAEATTIGPEMVKRGEIDYSPISSDLVDSWMANPETSALVSMERDDPSYSYFYAFNFNVYKLGEDWQRTGTDELAIDEKYEPLNWEKAVNNESFRQSIMSAVNRSNTIYVNTGEYADPSETMLNTITPTNNIVRDGIDAYTTLEPFKEIQASDFYNKEEALSYKEEAMTQLQAEGVTFPVKILVRYNPSTTNWEQESIVLEQQLESVLGTDYIDVILEAGPSENFLNEVRRSSDYMFMKCGWGGDYADPETWTDPFYQAANEDGSYHRGMRYAYLAYAIMDETASKEVVAEYFKLVEDAKAIIGAEQEDARFEAFAKAEQYLIDHALAIPYGVTEKAYVANKLNVFESQYSPSGVAKLRYKDMKLQNDFVSMEQYNANMGQ